MGSVVLAGATSGSTTITPSDTVTVTVTLPSTGGTLQTSGAGFTTNGVAYASSTSALTTGSSLVWTGSSMGVNTSTPDIFSRGYGTVLGVSNTGSSGTAIQINSGTSAYPALELGRGGTRTAIFDSQSTKTEFGNLEAVPLVFLTNSAEAMRIDTSQNVLMGITSSIGSRLSVNYEISVGTDGSNRGIIGFYSGRLGFGTVNAGTNYFDSMSLRDGNLLVGYTSSNGSYKLQVNSQIFATSAIIATSDARYKTNVTPISNGLALINKLNPVSFDWKEHSVHNFDTKNTNVGFLAQDVQEVLKNEIYLNSVIRKNETELPDGTKEEFLGLSDSSLIPILVKAIQEQQTLIESLTARLTALENK